MISWSFNDDDNVDKTIKKIFSLIINAVAMVGASGSEDDAEDGESNVSKHFLGRRREEDKTLGQQVLLIVNKNHLPITFWRRSGWVNLNVWG